MVHIRGGVSGAHDESVGALVNKNRNAHGTRRFVHDEPVGLWHATI